MVGYALYGIAPASSVSPPLARVILAKAISSHYLQLALTSLRTFRSEGLSQEH
jgi:hypothetical protein